MKNTIIISQKELKSSLTSPLFYIMISIFLAMSGFLFSSDATTYTETSISGFLHSGSILLLLLISAITMRTFAEEKKLGTIELLLKAPIKDSEIVLGKFIGCAGIIIIMLVFTFYYPILLIAFGDPDIGPIATGYLGFFLLSFASIAVGIFTSSITSNQFLSAIITLGILFGLWFLGTVSTYLPRSIGDALSFFSFSGHFIGFTRGIIDTRAIIYFLTITVLFLFLTIRSIENSRWN